MKNLAIIFSGGIYYSDLNSFEIDETPDIHFIEADSQTAGFSIEYLSCIKTFVNLIEKANNLFVTDMESDAKRALIIRIFTGMIVGEWLNQFNKSFSAEINFLDAKVINDAVFKNKKLSEMIYDNNPSLNRNLILMFGMKLAYERKIYDENKHLRN